MELSKITQGHWQVSFDSYDYPLLHDITDGHGCIIARKLNRADARFIVYLKASHETLLEAIYETHKYLQGLVDRGEARCADLQIKLRIEKAIAQATLNSPVKK